MQVKFYAETHLAEICNTDWEGEIRRWATPSLSGRSHPITINDYIIGQKLNYERPTSPSLTLIDQ